MPKIRLSVPLELRARIVSKVVFEWLVIAGCDEDSAKKYAKAGIGDLMLFKSIEVRYLSPTKGAVASVSFEFDWDSGSLTLEGDDESLVRRISLSAPITNEVAVEFSAMLRELRREVRGSCRDARATMLFEYVDDLEKTGKSRDEWNEELGLRRVGEGELPDVRNSQEATVWTGEFGGMVATRINADRDVFG